MSRVRVGRSYFALARRSQFGDVVVSRTVNGDDGSFLDLWQNLGGGACKLELAAVDAFVNGNVIGKLVHVKLVAVFLGVGRAEVFPQHQQSLVLEGHEGARGAALSRTHADERPCRPR